jgi:hypothetical protein
MTGKAIVSRLRGSALQKSIHVPSAERRPPSASKSRRKPVYTAFRGQLRFAPERAMISATRRAMLFRPTFVVGCALFAAVASAAGTIAAAQTGSIRGRIAGWEKLLPQVYAEAAKNDSRRYNWREPSPTVKQEFRKLSANVAHDVCVVALASGAQGHEHEPVSIKVTGGRITPSTIVLFPGSRLSFKNVDPFPHVLFEVGSDQWAANAVGPASTREWAAGSPGLHVIRDQLFPSVVMYVFVDPAAVEYALPDHEGGFSMTLPQGDYTLKVFFDGKPVVKETPVLHVGFGGMELKDPLVVGGG